MAGAGKINNPQEAIEVLNEIKRIASTVDPKQLETAIAGNFPRGKEALEVLVSLGAVTIPEMIQVMCDEGQPQEVRKIAVKEITRMVSKEWKTMPELVLYDAVDAIKCLMGGKAENVKEAAANAYATLAENSGLIKRARNFGERTSKESILAQNLQMCGRPLQFKRISVTPGNTLRI